MKVGLIGTGYMGYPMAEKLLEAGYELVVYNRTSDKAVSLSDKGAVVCETFKEACSLSKIILLMLSDFNAIKSLMDQIDLRSLEGKQIVQMSTIAPDESINLFEQLRAYDVDYVEAPVLGSIPQIKEKSLIVLFGGSQQKLKRLNKIFKSFAKKIEHIGKVGDAAAMKLALNQLIVGLTTVFSMSLGYVRASGLEVEKFMDIVRGSSLNATTFDKKFNNYQNRKYDNPNFPLKHLLKDLNLILDAFGRKSINIETLTGIQKVLEQGVESGLGELDYSALYEIVHANTPVNNSPSTDKRISDKR